MRAAKYQSWQERRPIVGSYGLLQGSHSGRGDGSDVGAEQAGEHSKVHMGQAADADAVGGETAARQQGLHGSHHSSQRGGSQGGHTWGSGEPLVHLDSGRGSSYNPAPFPFDQIPDEVWLGEKPGLGWRHGRLRARARAWVHAKVKQLTAAWHMVFAKAGLELHGGSSTGHSGLMLGVQGVVQGTAGTGDGQAHTGRMAAGSSGAQDVAGVMRQQLLGVYAPSSVCRLTGCDRIKFSVI